MAISCGKDRQEDILVVSEKVVTGRVCSILTLPLVRMGSIDPMNFDELHTARKSNTG